MVKDARISTGLPDHPKTKKLIRRCGQVAAWNLVRLILWAAANRADGDLRGLTGADLENLTGWGGDPGAFASALVETGFLTGADGIHQLDDWGVLKRGALAWPGGNA